MKSIQKIRDYTKEINRCGIPVKIHESMKCSRCRQLIGVLRHDENQCSAYPCLNPNCSYSSDYATIEETWKKMEAVQN